MIKAKFVDLHSESAYLNPDPFHTQQGFSLMEAPTTLAECIEVAKKCLIPVDTIARAYAIEAPMHEVDGLIAEAMAKASNAKGNELSLLVGIVPSWAIKDPAANRFLKELEEEFGPDPENNPRFRACKALIELKQTLAANFSIEEWTPPENLETVRKLVKEC